MPPRKFREGGAKVIVFVKKVISGRSHVDQQPCVFVCPLAVPLSLTSARMEISLMRRRWKYHEGPSAGRVEAEKQLNTVLACDWVEVLSSPENGKKPQWPGIMSRILSSGRSLVFGS